MIKAVIELSREDLAVAHEIIAGTVTSTEKVGTDLAAYCAENLPGVLDELIAQVGERVAALRRISDALLDAELALRFPT